MNIKRQTKYYSMITLLLYSDRCIAISIDIDIIGRPIDRSVARAGNDADGDALKPTLLEQETMDYGRMDSQLTIPATDLEAMEHVKASMQELRELEAKAQQQVASASQVAGTPQQRLRKHKSPSKALTVSLSSKTLILGEESADAEGDAGSSAQQPPQPKENSSTKRTGPKQAKAPRKAPRSSPPGKSMEDQPEKEKTQSGGEIQEVKSSTNVKSAAKKTEKHETHEKAAEKKKPERPPRRQNDAKTGAGERKTADAPAVEGDKKGMEAEAIDATSRRKEDPKAAKQGKKKTDAAPKTRQRKEKTDDAPKKEDMKDPPAAPHRMCTTESLSQLLNRTDTFEKGPSGPDEDDEVDSLGVEEFEKNFPTPKKTKKEAAEEDEKKPKKRDKDQHNRRMRFYRSLDSARLKAVMSHINSQIGILYYHDHGSCAN